MKYNIDTDIDITTDNPMQEKVSSASITIRKGDKEITYNDIKETTITGPTFVQVYTDGIKVLGGLSSAATSVLFYIFDNIQFGYNNIILHQTEVAENTNISQASVSRGLNELIANRIIFKSRTPYTYIINHNYFFKGSRKEYEDWLNTQKNKTGLYNNDNCQETGN